MVIDFHTHAFPDALAPRAIGRLSEASGGLIPYTDGSVSGLRARMAESGVSRSVMLSIATNAHQQRAVNDFAISVNGREGIFAFGSVFPDAPDAMEELERIAAAGLRGVKLHPDYQGFFSDDARYYPLYHKISDLGLITVFHAGVDYGFAPPYRNTPERMARAAKEFSSPVVAAHWGGVDCYEGVLTHLCGGDVYFDTSFGYSMLPKYYALQILERHGTERMLFGTDSPWHTAEMEWRLLDTLGLTQTEREAIAYGNAARLLGL